MIIILNGKSIQIPSESNIQDMTAHFCKDKTPVVAEVNGNIIQKSQWKESVLHEGDTVELVSFVGGG